MKSVCDEAGVPHPTIISESGRAIVAYHSVLVFDVLGVTDLDKHDSVPGDLPPEPKQPLSICWIAIHRDLTRRTSSKVITTRFKRSTNR